MRKKIKKRLLISTFVFLSMAVGIFISIQYLKLSKQEDIVVEADAHLEKYQEIINPEQKNIESTWIEKLDNNKKSDYYTYITKEIDIKLNPYSMEKKETMFRVTINNLDAYKFFCINQILVNNKINFSYYKSKGFVEIIISTKDELYLKSILAELKDYEIDYNVEKTYKG